MEQQNPVTALPEQKPPVVTPVAEPVQIQTKPKKNRLIIAASLFFFISLVSVIYFTYQYSKTKQQAEADQLRIVPTVVAPSPTPDPTED